MNYNRVYSNRKDLIEIEVPHVYMIIPVKYICTYHKLLIALSDLGIDMLQDCQSICKDNTKNIITCWNMFQAAIAAYNLNQEKQSDLLINYINGQLELILSGTDINIHNESFILPITPDGKLEAIVSCKNPPTFEVDTETGKLYEIHLNNTDKDSIYTIDDELNPSTGV